MSWKKPNGQVVVRRNQLENLEPSGLRVCFKSPSRAEGNIRLGDGIAEDEECPLQVDLLRKR